MGSLVRRKKPHVLLVAVAAFVLFGLLSPPVRAEESVEQRKLQMLELLGLNGADPAVIRAAQEADTLYAVDVAPGKDTVSVILQLSKLPAYDSNLYKQDRRLVIDLNNTINLSPTSVQPCGENGAIRQVRNSQYRVSPGLVSRVVLDLNEGQVPQITTNGTNLVITAPLSVKQPVVEATAAKPAANTGSAPTKVIAVPAVKVDTAAPKVDIVMAQVQEALVPPVEAAPLSEPAPAEATESAQGTETKPVSEVEANEPAAESASEEEGADEIAELMKAGKTAETSPASPASEVNVEPKEQVVQVPVKRPEQAKLVKALPAAAVETVPAAEVEVSRRDNLVTLNFRDADLSAVLDILARKGDLNILAGKDVKGTVTVRLIDVPFDLALNAVLNVNGYGYTKTDNIVRVLPLSQLGSKVETATETFMLSYAEAKKAKATLQGLLTTNGSIDTDDRTNMIIITDVPVNLDRIRSLIPQIDRRVQQVLIEVLIVDSVLSDAADLGVQWNLMDTSDSSLFQIDAVTQNDNIGVNLPLKSDTAGLNVKVGTLIDDFKLSVLIQALVTNTSSRILANPKILTVDNEKASIEIVQEFPYSDVTQTSSGGQLSNITFKEIGTKLEVRPQVTHDNHVILWLAPEQNSIAGETITSVPIVDTRKAETTLIVKNHQTVVLGGLRENRKLNTLSKVPFLGDLPGVKYVFRNASADDSDTELLVFLTVHIVESPPLIAGDEIKFDELANMPRKPSVSIDLIR
jgi:type IV pilus assembly protein PilQ